MGVVRAEDGTPIAGVRLIGGAATTDEQGRFTLHGFGPNASFQMNVSHPGYRH